MEHGDFINCPLVAHHRLLRHRLPVHLAKCRLRLQQQVGSTVARNQCTAATYQAEQLPPPPPTVEEESWDNDNYPSYTPQPPLHFRKPPPYQAEQLPPPPPPTVEEENWDNDNYPSYTPQPPLQFRKPPPFMTKSEKKRWRLSHREAMMNE